MTCLAYSSAHCVISLFYLLLMLSSLLSARKSMAAGKTSKFAFTRVSDTRMKYMIADACVMRSHAKALQQFFLLTTLEMAVLL